MIKKVSLPPPPPVNKSVKSLTTSHSGVNPSRGSEVTPRDVGVRFNDLNANVIQLRMREKEVRYLQVKSK